MTDELLTLGEVAKLLKVTTGQVHELTRHRSQVRSKFPLPVVKIHAKLIRVRRTDFEKWVNDIARSQSRNRTETCMPAAIKTRETAQQEKFALVRQWLRA